MIPFLIAGAAAIYALTRGSNATSEPTPTVRPTSVSLKSIEEDDDDDYPLDDYIHDCAEEWGMSEEDVENQLGFDKD